jgi:hypothetical protein
VSGKAGRTIGKPGRLICQAIQQRQLLEFDYKGKRRVVAPYCHGFSSKDSEVLRAIQVRGESSSGPGGGLGFGKLWTVAEMVGARVLDEPFTPDDPNYNPDDTAMARICCRV